MAPDLVSSTRRRVLGRLLRLRTGRRQLTDDSLLSLLPESALVPLQRDRLDPVEDLGRIREREPVSRLKLPFGVRGWLVTGLRRVKAVLAGGRRVQQRLPAPGRYGGHRRPEQHPGGLGFADPPDHTRLRQAADPGVHRCAGWPGCAPHRRHRRPSELDAMAGRPSGPAPRPGGALRAADPVADDLRAARRALRGPATDSRRSAAARFDFLGGAAARSARSRSRCGYLHELVVKASARARATGCSGDLVREHGDDISDLELAGLADGLLTGGLETTASMLALGALVLLQDPDCLADVRDRDEAAGAVRRGAAALPDAWCRSRSRGSPGEDITIGGQPDRGR